MEIILLNFERFELKNFESLNSYEETNMKYTFYVKKRLTFSNTFTTIKKFVNKCIIINIFRNI